MLAHDDLGGRYDPVWLRDVALHAERHGLRYLADAEPAELRADRQPPGVDEQLDALASGNRVVWEQYADLLAGRAFRQTLLCRGDAPRRRGDRAGAAGAAVVPRDRKRRDRDGARRGGRLGRPRRRRPRPQRLERAGRGLAARARATAFARFDELRETLGGPDPGALAAELWRAFRAGEVELSAAPDRHVTAAGERPEASPVARWQAARGPELTSLSHEPVRLDDPLGRFLIRLCDGTRDRPALADALVAGVGTELQLTMQGAGDGWRDGARPARGRAGAQPGDPRQARDAEGMTGAALYGEVPYSKFPYVQTHPDRLATLAVLHGLAPLRRPRRGCSSWAAAPAAT